MPMDITNLKEQFARNRSKSIVLLVLFVVMVGLLLRMVLQSGPKTAEASLAVVKPMSSAAVVVDTAGQKELVERARQSQALWKVLRERRGMPVGQLFVFDQNYYTLDPSRKVNTETRTPAAETTGTTEVRVTEPVAGPRVTLEEQVGRMQLQSTIMNADPIAVVNARLLRNGDVIDGFRVVSIQAREVTLEKDGKKVVLRMSR